MMKRTFLSLLLICLLTTGIQTARAQTPAPEGDFGYTVGYVTYDWEELQGQADVGEVLFLSYDDALSCAIDQTGYCTPTPIPLGLDFPFFENTYSELYVSINGLLLFGGSQSDPYLVNRPIPRDFSPQDIIAPYWDDLELDPVDGAVYYKTFANCPVGDSASACAIVEYYHAKKYAEASAPTFNFEIVLYPSGNLRIGYQSLPLTIDQCTVGIEDDQGIYGNQVYYNQTGLQPATMLQFTYPAPGYRLKAFPVVSGAFLNNYQVDLPFTLRNAGTFQDTYTLSYTLLPGSQSPADGWTFTFIDSTGAPITGGVTLSPGLLSEQEIRLRVTAPDTALRGDYARIQIDIDSPNVSPFTIYRQAAAPAPFTSVSLDTNRVETRFQTLLRNYTGAVFLGYTGGQVAIAHQSEAIYLPYWTRLGENQTGLRYYNTVVARVNAVGNRIGPRPLDDHRYDVLGVRDEEAYLAMAPNGSGAAVFVRRTTQPLTSVDLIRVSSSGSPIGEPLTLMDNFGSDGRQYNRPVVTALSDNRFVVVWTFFDVNELDESLSDLYYAVLDSAGNVIHSPAPITNAVYGGLLYSDASVVTMAGDNVLVVYQQYNETTGDASLLYRILDPDTGPGAQQALATAAQPSIADIAVLDQNNILVAWVDRGASDDFYQAQYAVLNASASGFVLPPTVLAQPDQRPATRLSVTADSQGNGVLVWGEVYTQRLYYTLVNSSGTVLTPPMTFRQAVPDRLLLLASEGGSLAYCPDVLTWKLTLPAVLK